MSRNFTDTYLNEATRTIFERPDMPVRHYDFLGRAQAKVGQAIAAVIKAGVQWINDQFERPWRPLESLTPPPTAGA